MVYPYTQFHRSKSKALFFPGRLYRPGKFARRPASEHQAGGQAIPYMFSTPGNSQIFQRFVGTILIGSDGRPLSRRNSKYVKTKYENYFKDMLESRPAHLHEDSVQLELKL
jgi:hypothetical protein